MKKALLTVWIAFIGCVAGQHVFAQVFHSQRDPFSYFIGTSEPVSDWFMPGFDDSGWDRDTGIIGYGYYYEGLPVEDIPVSTNAGSLYVRYHFNIENKEFFKKWSYLVDYDDGFIAWLNGKEILRINVDDYPETPAYDDLANRSHEMQVYGWDDRFPVLGYYLDSLLLDSCLVEGENVMAVQVLNDSADGSDLQLISRLYDITYGSYDIYSNIYRYKRSYDPDSTSFPLVWVETDEFGIPYKHVRRKAYMGIIDNGEGNYNHPADSCNVYSGWVSMEVRGESSAEFPKRSYRFELIDSLEQDSSVALLGMPSDDDWILLGPMHDKALFRNPMVFDMGRNLNGSYQPRSRFCELYFNGEYLGLYSLMETIKRDDDRVDIARLNEDEISGNDVTGGYILRFDKDAQPGLEIVYPKADVIREEQVNYIMAYFNAYTDVLLTSDFMDPEIGFRRFINDTSLVDYLIVNEITKNADSYLFSTYLYKDRDDRDPRFHFGPLWDMNLAFGNSTFHYGDRWDEWQYDNATNDNYKLKIRKLFQDEMLVDLFQERYHAAREGIFQTDSLLAYIDSMVYYIEEARLRNYEVWPVIDEAIFHPNYLSTSYEEEIWNIKNWLVNRLDWMDDNIDYIYYPVVIPEQIPDTIEDLMFSMDVYPNPFRHELLLDVRVANQVSIQLEIFDQIGRRKYLAEQECMKGRNSLILDDPVIQNLEPGVYLLRLAMNGYPMATRRIVKQ